MRTPFAFALLSFALLGPRQDMPPDGVTVPMGDIGGRPMVSLSLNGKGPYSFILDTGASFTGIDEDLARELSLPAAGGGLPPRAIRVDELKIGNFVARGFAARAVPTMLRGLGDNPPRGVLSAAAFPGCLVVFDYPGKRVQFKPGTLPAADQKRIFEYAATEDLPVIPVRIAGREYRIHLDTGSPAAVVLPLKHIPELPLEAPPVEIGQARTMAGTFPISRATVKGTIEIGEFAIDGKEIDFSDLRPGPQPGIGNVGAQVLRSFVVTVDAKNRRVKLDR